MGLQQVQMRVNAFFGDDEIDLFFPENWEVNECRNAGHDRPPLSADEMRDALRNPHGSPRLSEMAEGSTQVCIVFDDLPKPTPTSEIVPFVLEELHAGGITDEQIRFLCGPGCHRPLLEDEFVAKLGREIVEKYPVYNHSIWENVVYMGETSRGTPVHVNREFASCDLRVAIGSLFPHGAAGFGGGGKIILPGVSGLETIDHHHQAMAGKGGMGVVDGNVFRLDLEDAARVAGLHFKVDAVLNNRREVVGLFAGDLVAEHRAGARLARELYSAELPTGADVLVTNSYPDESQVSRALHYVPRSLREGGDVVLVTYSKDGQNLHQYSSRFGTDYGGRGYVHGRFSTELEKAERLIVLAPHLSRYDRDQICPPEKLIWCRSWAEVLAILAGRHGPGAKVAVFPYAPLMIAVEQRVPAAASAG
jgi:nickel-dependent lactate racemase